jgi:hypothetical protein
MESPDDPLKQAALEWTAERISKLSVQDIKRLRENAERLSQTAIVTRCTEALSLANRGSRVGSKARAKIKPRRLVPRSRAFEARGVWLEDPRTSWGGLRKSDGSVVIALWAESIESADGGCRYLLWAPNADGSRPWSDQPAGKERLEHCKRAMAVGSAEGLLVYGERCIGHLPEDKAYSVLGVDPEVVVVFHVEKRGAEFWAVWGKKAASAVAP